MLPEYTLECGLYMLIVRTSNGFWWLNMPNVVIEHVDTAVLFDGQTYYLISSYKCLKKLFR